MTVLKKKQIDSLDRSFESLLVYSTGSLMASSLRARRQTNFTTDLNRALTAVGLALVLLAVILFWNAIGPLETSRKDPGPEATDKPIGQSHSAERFRSPIPITKHSFRSSPELLSTASEIGRRLKAQSDEASAGRLSPLAQAW